MLDDDIEIDREEAYSSPAMMKVVIPGFSVKKAAIM